jgi:lysozyme family protein
MKDNFEESLRRVLAHEGGYGNHPSDPGGATNWGITIADARMYWKRDATPDDVKAMPRDVAKRIYKAQYWDKMRCDELPSGVDYAVFDFGVNSGVSRSIKYLERIANVPQDAYVP